jgi:hypothetical protein
VSDDVQDPLVLSEGWPVEEDIFFCIYLVGSPMMGRVHVVEEMVFGPRFPVVGSTLLSPKIRRRMSAYAVGFKGKLSEQ